mgnify:CR=1 FL=1
MAKTKTLAKLVDEAAVLLQKLVRLKAADDNGYCRCVSCGDAHHWKEMQGGHYIPRGKTATKLMEENIHPQCPACNGFGMKYGNAEKQYTLHMIDYYGREFVDRMIVKSAQKKKYARFEIEDLKKELNEQIREQLERVA